MSNDDDDKTQSNDAAKPIGSHPVLNGKNDDDSNVIRIPSLAERDRLKREQEDEMRAAYRAQNPREPLFNLPHTTKFMLIALIIPHLIMEFALSYSQQYWVLTHFGFVPASYTTDFSWLPALNGPFTYMLLHGSWLHLGMNSVMLLAFGAGLERWMGGRNMMLFFLITSLCAAAFHFTLDPTSPDTVIGASGGISGLFAAVLVMLHAQGMLPAGRFGIWPFAALWIGLSFIFGMMGGPDGSAIAWAAHIGGFCAGLILIKPFMRRFT